MSNVTTKELTPVDVLKKTVLTMKSQFAAALPPHIPVDRFIRVIQTAVSATPALTKCDRNSFLAACMRVAEQGLIPDGKECAIIPYGDKATVVPMVAGILKKVRNSGELQSITSQVVYKNDVFKYWVDGNGEQIIHEPNFFSDRGIIIGVYALAKTKDGGIYIDVLTNSDIDRVKKSSKSSGSGPWVTWPEEMMKKSAIKRLAKRLPSSTDLDQLLGDDDKDEFVNDPQPQSSQQTEPADEPIDVSPEPQPKKSKLETIVEASEVPI